MNDTTPEEEEEVQWKVRTFGHGIGPLLPVTATRKITFESRTYSKMS